MLPIWMRIAFEMSICTDSISWCFIETQITQISKRQSRNNNQNPCEVFGYRPQCWKTGTRILKRLCECWSSFHLLLVCWKAHSFRTKRNAFAGLGFPLSVAKRCCMCLQCLIDSKSLSAIIKHWLTNPRPCSPSVATNSLVMLHCTLILCACWCQGFKTLFRSFCSGSFSDVSVLCSTELYRDLKIIVVSALKKLSFFSPHKVIILVGWLHKIHALKKTFCYLKC